MSMIAVYLSYRISRINYIGYRCSPHVRAEKKMRLNDRSGRIGKRIRLVADAEDVCKVLESVLSEWVR